MKLYKSVSAFILGIALTIVIPYLHAFGESNEEGGENGMTQMIHTMLPKETCRIVWSNPPSQKSCIYLTLDVKTDEGLEIGFSPVGLHTGIYTFKTNGFRNADLTLEGELKADVTAFAHQEYQQPYDTVKWQKIKGSCRLTSTSLRCDVITSNTVITVVHDFKKHSPKIQELFYKAYLGDIKPDFSLSEFIQADKLQEAHSVNTLAGVKIVDIKSVCYKYSYVSSCESSLRLSIQNTTHQPQRYLIIKAEIYNKEKIELTNDSCFSGYEIIDIGKNLPPGKKVYIQSHLRKYIDYSTAEITEVQWHGLEEPDYNKVYPEINNECP